MKYLNNILLKTTYVLDDFEFRSREQRKVKEIWWRNGLVANFEFVVGCRRYKRVLRGRYFAANFSSDCRDHCRFLYFSLESCSESPLSNLAERISKIPSLIQSPAEVLHPTLPSFSSSRRVFPLSSLSLSLSSFLYRGRSDPVDVVGLEASFLTEFSQESRKRWVSKPDAGATRKHARPKRRWGKLKNGVLRRCP